MRLSRGNITDYKAERRERNKALLESVKFAAIAIGCNKGCPKTKRKCLKSRGVDLKEDRQLLKKQEKRYDSWMQTVHEGHIYVRKDRAFNLLKPCFRGN